MKSALLCCFLIAAAVRVALCSLIVGGKESIPHSRPYMVALYDYDIPKWAYQFCGGSLVHEKWVLTAAHCGSGTVFVGLGYHDRRSHNKPGQQYIEGEWHVHPSFNSYTMDSDIALIELKQPADLTSSKIATIGVSSSPPAAGKNLLIAGWGLTSAISWSAPKKLREAEVVATDDQVCKNQYAPGEITNNMFCAGVSGGNNAKDACQGDSGGPIVSNFGKFAHDTGTLLRGVVSFGSGCGDASYHGVYTKVSNYCGWISQTTGGKVQC